MVFAMLGVNTYGSKIISQVKENQELVNKKFSQILLAQAMVSLIVLLIYIFFIIIFSSARIISAIQIVYVIGCMFDINWLFFGLEKFKMTVTRNFIIKILTMILIFLFVKDRYDLYVYVCIMSLGTVISQLFMWSFYGKYFKLVKISVFESFLHYRGLITYFIPTIATTIYKIIGKLMLGSAGLVIGLAYYENSEKIINLVMSFVTSVGVVMLSRMSNLAFKGEKNELEKVTINTLKVIIFGSTGVLFGLIGISRRFVPIFFGSGYEDSIVILKILAITIIFSSISNVLRTQYLIPYGKDKEFSTSLLFGAVSSIFFNICLINNFGAIGVAISTVMAEFIVCIFHIWYSREILKRQKLELFIVQVFLNGLTMLLVISIIPTIMNNFVTLFIQIFVGGIIYMTLTLLMLLNDKGK